MRTTTPSNPCHARRTHIHIHKHHSRLPNTHTEIRASERTRHYHECTSSHTLSHTSEHTHTYVVVSCIKFPITLTLSPVFELPGAWKTITSPVTFTGMPSRNTPTNSARDFTARHLLFRLHGASTTCCPCPPNPILRTHTSFSTPPPRLELPTEAEAPPPLLLLPTIISATRAITFFFSCWILSKSFSLSVAGFCVRESAGSSIESSDDDDDDV